MPKASLPLSWLPEVAANVFWPWAGRASKGAGPKSAGERVGWEGLEKPQVDSVTFLLLCAASLHVCPLYHPSVRGLWVFEFPHALRPIANFYWPHHLIIQCPLKDFPCIFYPQSTWDQTSGIIFESFPP